jgi:pimeloyl-ACP methyl ester carboxylesterase
MEAALAWYRSAGTLAAIEVGPVHVPTLYVWGDADSTVGASAAHATAAWVTGPYRFELARGVGHCVSDEDPELATRVLLEHLRSVP